MSVLLTSKSVVAILFQSEMLLSKAKHTLACTIILEISLHLKDLLIFSFDVINLPNVNI